MKSSNQSIDLMIELPMDTYLSVKWANGKFTHYMIPTHRKDGSRRLYGDLYSYFTGQKDFRFAKGYRREEEEKFWKAEMQYFYFDKKQGVVISTKLLETPLFHLKQDHEL